MFRFAFRICALGTIAFLLFPYVAFAVDVTHDTCSESELDRTGGHANTECANDLLQLQAGELTGTYESPVINAGEATQWTRLGWTTTRPMGKAITSDSGYASGNMSTTNLELLLHMDDASGNPIDASSNAFVPQSVNGITYGAGGRVSDALDFSGSSVSSISYGDQNTFDFSGSFTVSAWIKTSGTDYQYIMQKITPSGNGWWYLQILNDGRVRGRTVSSSGTSRDAYSTTVVNDGAWHHVAFVYDSAGGGLFTTYVDGQGEGTDTGAPGVFANTSPFEIGRRSNHGTWDYPFAGVMDEVAIWSRALSGTEIEDLYLRGATDVVLSFRTCDDAACSGESYEPTTISEEDNTAATSPSIDISSLTTDQQYAQYKIDVARLSSTDEGAVSSVTISYAAATTPEFSLWVLATVLVGLGFVIHVHHRPRVSQPE